MWVGLGVESLWVLLMACGGSTEPLDTGTSGTADTDTDPPTATDTDTDTEPVEVESVPGVEVSADGIFAVDQVHTLEITLGEELTAALGADPYTYVETDVVFDGRPLDSIGVRLKGKIGSFRSLRQKASFKLDFNRFRDGLTLDGLKKLNVDNMVQDTAQLHDRIANAAYRAVGIPSPRVGYAWVTVDGEAFGLYSLVEEYDKVFLKENFAEPEGNLYDGDYWLDPMGVFTMLDFDPETQQYFDLDVGTDVELADIRAVTNIIGATCGTGGFDEAVDEVLDYAWFLRLWAMEVFVGQWDGYCYGNNNYRVYFDPGRDGRAVLMPWDHGAAFYDMGLNRPVGLLADCCKQEMGCKQRIYDEVAAVCAELDVDALTALLDETAALISPFVVQDPRKELSPEAVQEGQDAVRDWLAGRCAALERWDGL